MLHFRKLSYPFSSSLASDVHRDASVTEHSLKSQLKNGFNDAWHDLLKFSIAAAPFKHTDFRQQKEHKSFNVFPCLVVICSKLFDVTMAFTWTFLQNELHTSFSFQGSHGVSSLSFHKGTALALLSLPFLLLSTGRKFLGKGRRAQGTHRLLFGAPWDDGSWTGGQLLQGWVEIPKRYHCRKSRTN